MLYTFSCKTAGLRDHVEPLYNLVINVEPIPVKRPSSPRSEFRMASIEQLRPIFAWRLARPSGRRPPTGKAERYRTYVLYSHRTTESIVMYKEFNNGCLFPRFEVLLALGLLFHRPASACTMLEGSARDMATVRQSTERSATIVASTFNQCLAGSIHLALLA